MLDKPGKTMHRRKITIATAICILLLTGLFGRLIFLMVWRADYYSAMADRLHERERSIKAARGQIQDRNGIVIADNKTVCTVSVIHSQIQEPERVIEILSRELGLSREYVTGRVEKRSAIERIKSNVEKAVGDRIREYDLAGVKVDEDYKRYYPYGALASKVLGFTGSDNQGIIGLEVKYDEVLRGEAGMILTMTDAAGIEIEEAGERRKEPVKGQNLVTSLDVNIQSYATQLAEQVMASKEAEAVSILVMNPQNGEILAMVDAPEFDLNDPYAVPMQEAQDAENQKQKQELLNRIWRNGCINDTYEPGSTFKIITAAAGLEEGVVTPDSSFGCPGYIIVEDRKIRCHKTTGHGGQTFTQGIMNSCNPISITVGLRLGIPTYMKYFEQFGLREKTGIDLPGEAATIMHREENMGEVELATVAFGQSFQITPIRLITTVSAIVNGGKGIVPHLGIRVEGVGNDTEDPVRVLQYPVREGVLSEKTSEVLRGILEKVVSEGTGKNGYVEGFRIGGKTATSQTLPRGSGRYIASYIGFAPAEDPQVIALAIVHNPQGIYYGGQVAAPIVRQLFENILPYLGIMNYNEE